MLLQCCSPWTGSAQCHEEGGQLRDGIVFDLPLSCFSPQALDDSLTFPFLDGTGWKLSSVSVHWAPHTDNPGQSLLCSLCLE